MIDEFEPAVQDGSDSHQRLPRAYAHAQTAAVLATPDVDPGLDPDLSSQPESDRLETKPGKIQRSILYLGNRVGPHTNTPHSKKHKLERLLEAINPTVPTCAALCFYERKRAFQPDPFTSFQVKAVYFPLHHVEHL